MSRQRLVMIWRSYQQANGLMVQTADGRHSIKASGLDRSVSKTKLEKRFGAYELASQELLQSDAPAEKYAVVPLHKEPDRDKLYGQFKAAMAERQVALQDIDQQDVRLYAIYKQNWDKKRAAIKKIPMMRAHRQKVMKELNAREKAERAVLRQIMSQKRAVVRDRYPFNSWTKFLRHQAGRGNETALAILRSKQSKVPPNQALQAAPSQSDLSKGKTALASVAKMRKLFQQEGLKEPRYSIDTKGTIIFKLPGGGSIRDAGDEVHYSHDNDLAKQLATKLAQSRWGQSVSLEGNVLKSSLFDPPQHQQPPVMSDGLGR